MENQKRFVPISFQQLPDVEMTEQVHQLATDIFTFVNYEQLKMECEANGSCIKEEKDFYAERVIHYLELYFKGKTKLEIEIILNKVMRD